MLLFCFALASRINLGGNFWLAYQSTNIANQSQNWKHPKIKTVRLIDRYHPRNAKAIVVDKLWQSLPYDNLARCLAYLDPTYSSQIGEPRMVGKMFLGAPSEISQSNKNCKNNIGVTITVALLLVIVIVQYLL